MEDIIVEIDKKVAVSFSKRFKNYTNENGNEVSLNLQDVKKDITEYVSANLDKYKDKEVFSFVYDYDLGICITMMKPKMEYEVYTVFGIKKCILQKKPLKMIWKRKQQKTLQKH